MFAVSKMGNVEGECVQGNVCPTLHEATYSGLMLLLLAGGWWCNDDDDDDDDADERCSFHVVSLLSVEKIG